MHAQVASLCNFKLMPQTNKQPQQRNTQIDLLRTLAIFTMTITHSAIFFHDYSNPVIVKLANIGGDISYSLFLFCFGAAIYYSYLKSPSILKRNAYLKKSLIWVILYYVLIFIGMFALYIIPFKLWGEFKPKALELIIKLLTFRYLVEFTEFFITFPIFLLIAILLPKLVRLISTRLFLLAIFSLTFYLLASITQNILNAPSFVSLFTGYEHLHYFPVLMYASFFMLGIYYAENYQKLTLTHLAVTSVSMILITVLLLQKIPFLRFPPTLSFLTNSIAWIFSSLFLIELFNRFAKTGYKVVLKYATLFSQNALSVFVCHTLVIFTYNTFVSFKTPHWYIFLPLWLGSLLLSLAISLIFSKLVPLLLSKLPQYRK